jgi:hypothetical protein
MHHDNDNTPRTPAEHRAAVAAQRVGQGNREVRFRNQNWPTFGRLKRADAWREIQTLERYAEDEGISMPQGHLHAANDNSPVDDTGRTEIISADGARTLVFGDMPDVESVDRTVLISGAALFAVAQEINGMSGADVDKLLAGATEMKPAASAVN